jgi:hypothetical protein
MRRFLMRDEDGNTCPKCGGTGRLRNYRTMSPSDDEPCPCTLAREMWEELVEKDDRTSPKEYPDMVLISFEELCNYIVAARAEALEEAANAIRALAKSAAQGDKT